MSHLPPRLLAAHIIEKVIEGRSLTDCLDTSLHTIKNGRDRAFVQAICYGVCRYYTRLDVLLSYLLTRPMKAKDSDLHALLLVGLYQLTAMRIQDYAAVTETVNAALKLKKPWARGLINAVLRQYLRHREKFDKDIQADEEAWYAHPIWWIDQIKQAWPAQWQEVLHENNGPPPFALRVNSLRLSREDYLKRLEEAHYSARPIMETEQGIVMDSAVSVDELPGFFSGDVSVQDGAAQLAAECLELKPNQRVLDACAAPGGKLTHLLETEPQLAAVVAIEKEASRLLSIQQNLERLHLTGACTCIHADAAEVEEWWDGQLFDRILLDAPCSGSGVIRRHPDIKLLRRPTDIKPFSIVQLRLLNALWTVLKPNGLLLYATCSIFPEENTHVLQAFLLSHPEAKEEKIVATWGLPCEVGRQVLPGMSQMDGFYYAKLRKSG